MHPKCHLGPNQAGFTLIETIMVLGIAGLIIGGIWMGYSTATRAKSNAIEEQQIADELTMIRNYMLQFNENNPKVYRPNGVRMVITDQFVNNNLLPASVEAVTGNAAAQMGYPLPDDGNNFAIKTEYGANGIATVASSGNPYGSGPIVAMGFYGFSFQACADTISEWAGSPDRVQKSGMIGAFRTAGWVSGGDTLNQNNLTGQASFDTTTIQNVCNVPGGAFIFLFRLNP